MGLDQRFQHFALYPAIGTVIAGHWYGNGIGDYNKTIYCLQADTEQYLNQEEKHI